MVQAAIVGTGDQAYGLAHLFSNSNSGFSGNFLEVTKPSVHHMQVFHDTGVAVVTMENALAKADIIILAIPSSQLSGFVHEHLAILRNKILVDVTNSHRPHEDLQSVLGICDHQIRWVKAFNDIGAVDVLLDKPTYKSKRTTKMCAADPNALKVVKAFAEESLGLHVKVVPYERYNDIGMAQNSLGKEWIHAALVLLFVFSYSEFYAVLRYNVFKGYAWFHLPIQVTNKAICWTSLTGMALAQLPGVLARAYDSYQGNNLVSKPRILVWSLSLRKHVGVLSLWFLICHIIMSLLLMNEKYYGKFFEDPKANASKMNVIGETSFFFATMGTGLYIIMGLCSLSSIGSQMTNLQWQVVYGPVAWVALLFGTLHVMVMGVKGWATTHKWPGGLPPITMTSVLVPLFVILLKLLQKIYCTFNSVNSKRDNVRQRQYRATSSTKNLLDPTSNDDDNSNSSLADF